MKKAVFFDIDGTLWGQDMHVPESAAGAIRLLRRRGNYAFLCSGRSRAAICAKELFDIGFDGILAGCGTYIEYAGEVVFERKLSAAELAELIGIFEKYEAPVVIEGRHCLYADLAQFQQNAYILLLKQILGERFVPLLAKTGDYDANKMTAYLVKGGQSRLQQELGGRYELLFHTPEIIEVLPKGFSKAGGIEWICGYLHLAREDTYAFGDSVNDVEMLRYAGHGIAMGNATKIAKEAADYVTDELRADGILNGLKHFALI